MHLKRKMLFSFALSEMIKLFKQEHREQRKEDQGNGDNQRVLNGL